MYDLEDAIAQFLVQCLATEFGCQMCRPVRTCSVDVLTNTGGPFKQLMKMGMMRLRNAGYMCPET